MLSRETRLPPLLGVGLAAILMGSVAVATAQASLPSRQERAAAGPAPKWEEAETAADDHAGVPKFFFVSPLAGYAVNSPFGLRKMPWEGGGRLHEGVDIAAPSGVAVRATAAGVVVRSGVDGGYGRFVEIRHDSGLTSLYAHLGRLAKLKTGAWVQPGAVVGYVGSSGRSTGAHLHFEIRHDGRPLNPVVFMGRAFRSEADLPLTLAARVPRRIRVAQVSEWPAEILARKARVQAGATTVAFAGPRDGRVRAVIQPTGKALVAPAVERTETPVAPPTTTPAAPSAMDAASAASTREIVATAR